MTLLSDSPPTYFNVLRALEEALADAGVETPRRTAEWMLLEVIDGSRAQLYAHSERTISEEILLRLEDMLERRRQHEPLQYILGYAEFYGLRLRVSPSVLIPRPETERVVEHVLTAVGDLDRPRVLDIGTGSGCIALAVAHERSDAAVVACDDSVEALEVARDNARDLGLNVEFRRGDVESEAFLAEEDESFDAVVSNPPYVTPAERDTLEPEVQSYEPEDALFTPGDALHFYRIVAEKGWGLLRSQGWIVFETHADYGSDVADLLRRHGYTDVELHRDWAKRPRVVLGRRPAGVSAPDPNPRVDS